MERFMPEAPLTRASLIARLRDFQDRQAWEQFVELYAPAVYAYGRKQGLQDADAADLTQSVLRSVAGATGRFEYDPQRGSFRGWLFTIVRRQLRSFRSRPEGLRPGSGDSGTQQLLEAQPDHRAAADWERWCERQLFTLAAQRVQPHCQPATWNAFWKTAIEGKPGKEVAAELGMTVAAVYLARSRVLAKLRLQIQELQGEVE
jgi:RNA polymerase sigma-70 factor (ECF subfamily)